MRPITKSRLFERGIVSGATHILSLGFEERCLGYPHYLSQQRLDHSHTFLAIDPGDDRVNLALREKREEHWRQLRTWFPSIRRGGMDELTALLRTKPPGALVFDISALPKPSIVAALHELSPHVQASQGLFVVYSYPASYPAGLMQEPGAEVSFAHEPPVLATGRANLVVIPGFERSFTDIGLTWIKAATRNEPSCQVMLPFPGRKYQFFERALESHLDLIADSSHLTLFCQDHLLWAQKQILNPLLILSSASRAPTIVLLTGPRILVVAAALVVRELRAKLGPQAGNLMFVLPRHYASVRPGGIGETLVEFIPAGLFKAQ